MTNTQNKIAIFSDLHLGIHTNSSQWHDIAVEWCEWFVESIKSKNIQHVVFCGDWHHNRSEISVDTLHISAKILRMFKGLNLYMITGNHDQFYKNRTDVHSLNIFKDSRNVYIYDKVGILEMSNGKKFTMIPWGFDIADLPPSDGCFGHLEVETFNMTKSSTCEDGIKISDLLKKFPLSISGHFHLRDVKKFNTGTILYVGSPFHMDFGDVDSTKGYYILDTDTLKYEFVENTISPTYQIIKLSDIVTRENIDEELQYILANNFVKLIVDRNISQEHLNILVNILHKNKVINLTLDYDITSNKILSNTKDKDFSGVDIPEAIEEFIRLLAVDNKKDVSNYILSIYKECCQSR